MKIQYNIVVTIINIIDDSTSTFNKTFEKEINTTDALLYNNHHILSNGVYILDMFEDEVNAYCSSLSIETSSIEVDEFEIVSLTDKVDVFFESEDPSDSVLSLKPIIKCYIHPKNDALKVPKLVGTAYDSTTIIWSWPDDEEYAHYLIEEAIDPDVKTDKDKIIAQLPIGTTSYTETGLEPNTPYTRRLINYTDEQTSSPSPSVTIMTETIEASESLESYSIAKNYDFTTDDSERNIIEEKLTAFHSGVGDGNDLKVYKQMDADFYQKFKAYFEITGRRIQREKRYDQVGFNYKVCLEAVETIEEQEGEVTFDVDVYPREEVTIQDYIWTTDPVTVYARVSATMFLRKEAEVEEVKEIKVYKPKFEPVVVGKEPEYVSKDLGIVFIIDLTNSLDSDRGIVKSKICGGVSGIKVVKNACIKCIKAIEKKKGTANIKYAVISYGLYARLDCNFKDAQTAINAIQNLSKSGLNAGYTSWGTGIKKAYETIKNHSSSHTNTKYISYFFSDGFPNSKTGASGSSVEKKSIKGSTWKVLENEVFNDLKIWADKLKSKCHAVGSFICNYKNGSNYVDINDTSAADNGMGYHGWYIEKCHKVVAKGTENAMFWNKSADLLKIFKKFIKAFTVPGKEITENTFIEWDEDEEYTDEIYEYSIDKVKAVNVTSDIFSFTFNNSITPAIYSRDEKRAIIPASSFLSKTKLTNKSIYKMLLEAAKKTPEWLAGYNKTVGTVEKDGEPDKFLIKGLHVEDTYNFGDEDIINENIFGAMTWEDGLEGTVNTYGDVDKAGTTTYGDDCYLISEDSYLYIDGYTDAIIYDGNRFATTELNAYDHMSTILISPFADYSEFLFNRKDKDLQYEKSGLLNHVVDIVEIGKDIHIDEFGYPIYPGDWLEFKPLTDDLVAYITTYYESPILNYRFNLEDPDARTPLYEILPTCDPLSEYRNVVIIHIYYARNVWIIKDDNYVEVFGTDPIATTSSSYIPLKEGLYKYTLKEWEHGVGNENGWFIDEYIWFMAKPMFKTQKYYDELPGPGMDTFYGLVNGRYRSDNQDGKKDLIVDCPQFNIPTTVDEDTIRIYIMITEFYPDTALVSYKWDHPWNNKDGITMVNGDYVTFSSDSLTYKDIDYYDIISTVNMENQEVFDNKSNERIFELEKPKTVYEYVNYYLQVSTDNGDVLALRYPTEITFDEEDKANVGVVFKGVLNATSKWSPRIHNGYYYLNQHEYFAYCEFDVEANFDTIEEENFKTAVGYISIDVQLRRKAGPKEDYSITKNTRSELLQNEEKFIWIDGKGLTLKPFIEGEYYKEYLTYRYTSPVILFPNILTEAGKLKVDYSFDDDSKLLVIEVRSYIVEEGKWSEWKSFTNNTVPNVPLSCGYQVRFYMQATTWDTDITVEDYMCCYLDWKDDMEKASTTNIVTITDHMTTGPDEAAGIYISRIIDFGCKTEIDLSIFDSKYEKDCQLYIGVHDTDPSLLLIENIEWTNITYNHDVGVESKVFTGRYLRYKIEIPCGEKVYWLHKKFITKKTDKILPYLTGISMTGVYKPTDIVTNFINTESFEIPTDGKSHKIFNRIIDTIGADVLEKGFKESEIEYVKISCTSPNITLTYDKKVEAQYPKTEFLQKGIEATAKLDYEIVIKNTPFIFSEIYKKMILVKITKGTPQQYCPITVEDEYGNTYTQVYNEDLCLCEDETCICPNEEFNLTEETKYIELRRNDYDKDTLKIYLNDKELTSDFYKIVNHLVIFNDFLKSGDKVTVYYKILNSFYTKIDREKNTTDIIIYTNKKDMETLSVKTPRKYKVYFETSTRNNKFIAKELSLNPIYRTDYKGFIYLTDEHNEPYSINIYCNPKIIKAGGYDKVDISIEVLDILGNPVISKNVAVDCKYGILNCENYVTDMNGVVHIVYESSYKSNTDTITAKVTKDDSTTLQESIEIINE